MRTRILTEIAAAVALATVLGLFKIPLPHLIYGGSVSLETLPVLVVACRRGWRPGALAGAALGTVDFLLKPVVVHPAQVLLDYPVAFGVLGWAAGLLGCVSASTAVDHPSLARLRVLAGILAGNGARLAAHFASGIIFFAAYAPAGQPVWLYSLLYNLSYLVPQVVFHIILLQLVMRILTLHR